MLESRDNPPPIEDGQSPSEPLAVKLSELELGDLKMESLVRAIWVRSKPTATGRIALLRAAIITIQQAGSLTEEQREAAVSAAHNLAGVLGTFGFPQGTDAARRIELLLESGPATLATAEALSLPVAVLEEIVRQ